MEYYEKKQQGETIYIDAEMEGETFKNDYHPIKLKDVKNGDFFRLKASETAHVYEKKAGDYDRSEKAFYCSQWDGSTDTKIKPSRVVYVGFCY